MPTQWQTYPFKLEGGLITNLGKIEQGINAPGSATVLQNFEPDVKGGYTRILGYSKFSDTAVPGLGQIYGVVALSETEALAVRGTEYQYSTGTSWAAKLTLTNPTIARIRWDSYNFTGTRKTVVVDEVNPPAFFDHTTKTMAYAVGAPSEVIGASRVRVFKNHLFFTKGRNLAFSSPFLEGDFNPANGAGVINVGDDITGIIVFRDQLIVLCLNSIYRVSGNTEADFVLAPIAMNTGCLCGDTVQEVGGDVMYLGPDGIRYLSATERNNDFGLVRASEKIQPKILSIVNSNCVYSSVTLAEKNQYRLFYHIAETSVANSRGFLSTKYSNQTVDDIAWAELKGFKIYGISKFQGRDGEAILFTGSTGFIYLMESGNSLDGESIEAIFETPYLPITDPKIRKTLYKHTLYAQPSGFFSLTAQAKFDYDSTGPDFRSDFVVSVGSTVATYGNPAYTYGTSKYGKALDGEYYSNILGSGFVVAFRYTSNDTSLPYNLNFVVLDYRNNERR